MSTPFGSRRAVYIDLASERYEPPLSKQELGELEAFDAIYRSLCAILYNYVPTSGHPGGSISSGRFVASILFDAMDYDVSRPDRKDADLISYAAGHKALGLYAMWALRNEVVRISNPQMLPDNIAYQLRLEDLLGFRRNPTSETPLFRQFHSKALDGHPTPATPFVKLATGASGVGDASSIGLALGAMDTYPSDPPRVHVVEGEGGLTPGRVAEALAFAGTASLGNVLFHIDWNQASIDSNHVTRDENGPGDYVQWDPRELFYLHDWNVINVPDGFDFQMVVAAQRMAKALDNGQPTAIVYRTIKGWQYGITGRASHGAGHKMCSPGFYDALQPVLKETGHEVPACDLGVTRCGNGQDQSTVEACFWQALGVVRETLEANRGVSETLGARLVAARKRLDARVRTAVPGAKNIETVYDLAREEIVPEELLLQPGTRTTLRGQLGKVLGYYNRESRGAMFVAAADLLGSTSVIEGGKGFPEGFYNAKTNPESRVLSVGGICEDAIAGVLSGLSAFGTHVGAASSYGAFIAPLGHIAARLHAIGSQARQEIAREPYKPMILICAHAGLKTGEDGPTHADPQPLQLLQENFPHGTMITLTPWEPQEVYPLMSTALVRRPAVIAPFVTRPDEAVIDREKLGLAPAMASANGVYRLRRAKGEPDGVVVLQESGVTYAFVEQALAWLQRDGIDLDVYYVASAELFDMLPEAEKDAVFPESAAQVAMGITGFTMATMYRWIRSDFGRKHSLHPYMRGRYPGSGQGRAVIAEAGLDAEGQYRAITKYVEELAKLKGREAVAVS
jgi:transketolase